MREPQWMQWIRTTIRAPEREVLLATLTSDQQAQLRDHDYVRVAGAGVLWRSVDGALRRTRFTHGTHFRTKHSEFYMDSEGRARELADPVGAQQSKDA